MGHISEHIKENEVLNEDLIVKCMHCALCLPSCPTYAITGDEKSSPRGRIRLMRSVASGELGITKEFVREMNFCLDCQACETACPAGVHYGSLVESARVRIAQEWGESPVEHLLKKILLNWAFRRRERFEFFARLLRLYRTSGLQWLIKSTKVLLLFSRRLHEAQSLTPIISKTFSSQLLLERVQSTTSTKYKAGFLTGCFMDVAFADVNVDTVRLLTHHGCDVFVPPEQICCGSLQAHNGDFATAQDLARRNIDAFSKGDLDVIIMNSAGCGAFMKQYGEILSEDPQYAERAAKLASKVKDLTEFLADVGLRTKSTPDASLRNKRVTYHDACHLAHSQKITEQPRKLVRAVPTIEFSELPESSWCCGSAGTYNITHYEASMQLLERKLDNVKKISPQILVTSNPGCLIQLKYGMDRDGLEVELLHIATFLRRACCD